MDTRNINLLFSNGTDLQPCLETCARIGNDANYNSLISDEELMALWNDSRGNPNGTVSYALAISLLDIHRNANGECEGFIYQIRKTHKTYDEDIPYIFLDKSIVIYVELDGSTTLHLLENAMRNDFTHAVEGLSADDYLNQPSLHSVDPVPRAEGAPDLR
jgi:hypothetical protein